MKLNSPISTPTPLPAPHAGRARARITEQSKFAPTVSGVQVCSVAPWRAPRTAATGLTAARGQGPGARWKNMPVDPY
eukprot:scaffold10208_cov88-Phaeocystis_antarctica.AAC.1